MFEGEQRVIEKRLKDNWTDTPIKWEGKPFKHNRPEYIAPFILPGLGDLISIGAVVSRIRQVGVLIVQIFTPPNVGTNKAARYADVISTIFRNVSTPMTDSANYRGTIHFRTPYLNKSGLSGGSNLLQTNLYCPFDTRHSSSPEEVVEVGGMALVGDEGQQLVGDEGQDLFGDDDE